MNLDDPVRYLAHVGPVAAKRLEKLNIFSIRDLLFHLPFRYDDFSKILPIVTLKPDQTITIKGEILKLRNEFTKTGKKLQRGKIKDNSGIIDVIWFNQLYLPKVLPTGTQIALSGKVDWFGRSLSMISPEYEIINPSSELIHTGRLVPVYPETAGVSSKWLRSRIKQLLDNLSQITDPLPVDIITSNNLFSLTTALNQIHFPNSSEQADLARRRLAFDELLELQLASASRKNFWCKQKIAHRITINQERISTFISSLPFNFTHSQERSVKEIISDLSKPQPMNRLLEGDVGSGKTVVAATAAYAVYLCGLKTIFMAPTEILANQHAKTLELLLTPLGVRIGLLTSSKKIGERDQSDILVGTHALLHHELPSGIAFVVVDEQHRFGVAQRSKLIAGSVTPHLLTMTATPIPRTVALTLYGDLELSTLDELPEGRKQIKTYVVPPEKRLDAFKWVEKQVIQDKTQAFIIYPIIEESGSETLKSVRAAKAEFEKLQMQILCNLRLGLLHGRMSSKEKEKVMEDFKTGRYQILVATPVVEVGIDIAAATIILIEGAERFGLAQLHQLRGRVGRGNTQSYCLFLTESNSQNALNRLKNLTSIFSGSLLAELDLKLRGPGDIYGLRQHGYPDLKAADLNDQKLIIQTKQAALSLLPRLSQLPLLRKALETYTIAEVTPN
jgi:ATP-dependent DNA helicase RecG